MRFMRLDFTSLLIASFSSSSSLPFPPLPVEITRLIFELTALGDKHTSHSLLLVSNTVRRWIHPITYETVEIFGLQRMVAFAAIFAEQSLLATSVRNLTLYDDTTGDFIDPSISFDPSFMPKILSLCRGIRRLALNYIRPIPPVDGLKPYELIVRRGLRCTTLAASLLNGITHLHCRYEQLMQPFLGCLATSQLTHVCFTHHLDFSHNRCQEAVEFLLGVRHVQMVIVEVGYRKWHRFEDPTVRRALAENNDDRLIMRLSRYSTVHPYDTQSVFSDAQSPDIWDVTEDREWRSRAWNKESITRTYELGQRYVI